MARVGTTDGEGGRPVAQTRRPVARPAAFPRLATSAPNRRWCRGGWSQLCMANDTDLHVVNALILEHLVHLECGTCSLASPDPSSLKRLPYIVGTWLPHIRTLRGHTRANGAREVREEGTWSSNIRERGRLQVWASRHGTFNCVN
eukprot:538294-Prymnesium_polylepis.1